MRQQGRRDEGFVVNVLIRLRRLRHAIEEVLQAVQLGPDDVRLLKRCLDKGDELLFIVQLFHDAQVGSGHLATAVKEGVAGAGKKKSNHRREMETCEEAKLYDDNDDEDEKKINFGIKKIVQTKDDFK